MSSNTLHSRLLKQSAQWTLIIITLLLSYCRFDQLKPELLFKIPINKKDLDFPQQYRVYYGIPGKIGIEDETLVISEPSTRTIKIFYREKFKVVIYSKDFYDQSRQSSPPELPSDIIKVFLKELQVPGVVATTSDNSFYVLNYIPNTSKGKLGEYNILHIDFSGQLKAVLKKDAASSSDSKNKTNTSYASASSKKNGSGFPYLNWLDVDDENRLWISYRSDTERFLESYNAGQLLHRFSETKCAELLFQDIEKASDEKYSCETFYPFSHGESILLVGKTEEVNTSEDEDEDEDEDETQNIFKERIFISYNLESNKTNKIFSHQSSPQESPYLTYGEESFIIWITEDYHHFRLEVYNIYGEQEKNFEIRLSGSPHSWRSTYTTLRGNIHSTRILNDSLFVYRWH